MAPWFFWSAELLTAENAKLELQKFAILFTIADVFWVKKNMTNACYEKIQKISNINPLLSFTLHGVNHSPG